MLIDVTLDHILIYFHTILEDWNLKLNCFVFFTGEIKCLMTQLLKAVHHLHDNWILHRDLKTSNLLLSHKGVLKVNIGGYFLLNMLYDMYTAVNLYCVYLYLCWWKELSVCFVGGRLRAGARVRLAAAAVHADSGDAVVPRARAAALLQGVLHAHRHVERRLHICWIHHNEPFVPRKVWSWST